MLPTSYYEQVLADIYGHRRWIFATDVLAGAAPVVDALGRLGAAPCLCIATSHGTGDPPDATLAPDPIVVVAAGSDVMGSIRASLSQLANLPPEAVARVDAFDPERNARVLGTLFDDGRPVAGRAKYGARLPEWQRLEDKTTVDALWDAAGAPRAPSAVVPARLRELEAASRRLDAGQGTIWAGDSREGFNGGASYVRWVRNDAQAAESAAFFEAHCDRVRVMPFLEGIPCSIHGLVFAEHTIVFRPCEMIVFRQPGSTQLHYGRAASFWDPPDCDRLSMRDIARHTGEHLRKMVGYRGAFTVDGVLTGDGFLPTELNPRLGAGLFTMTKALDIPLLLLNAAIIENESVDWQPLELERLLVEFMDAKRAGGGGAFPRKRLVETHKVALVRRADGRFEVGEPDEAPDAIASVGPAPAGSFVGIDLVPERTPVGPSVAPRIAAALACLDQRFELGLGTLEPARDVRSGTPCAD